MMKNVMTNWRGWLITSSIGILAGCGGGASDAIAAATGTTNSVAGVQPAEIVAAHNTWRSQVGVEPIAYSDTLAASAQAWANQLKTTNNCAMQHSGTSGVGENLYWASAWSNGVVQNVKSADVVNVWGAEKSDYTYATNTCAAGKVCGHYTQVVWKNTTQVGCGMAICDSPKNQVWVCQYAPPGNYVGQKPY